ncbi:fasciclin domain-containing protein [Nocardioides sediminis]|uniref:fasciclin domain-containing protein n=1 Tax=Nocardioides sediminis TaxID=433648 RepID=UPI000D326334|nr:fasciclin domain-containing protein [Nocardioides sediminis]
MKTMKTLISSAAVVALSATALAAPAAADSPRAKALGTTSIAEVLAADGSKLDKNWKDFDILEAAVTTVLAEDGDSAVAVLADGKKKLTAFAPTDKAFRMLVKDLSGKTYKSEARVATWLVDNVGAETIETVLLYHVVPGAPITAAQAVEADGAELTTAQGGTIEVKVKGNGKRAQVVLVDQDHDDWNPAVKTPDVNEGNRQIAHGINRVLRPVDL